MSTTLLGSRLTGGTGDDLGQELDLVVDYKLRENLSLQLDYFWFWYGNAITNGPLIRGDARQAYMMTTWNY